MSSDFELMGRLVIDSVLTTIYRSIPLEQPGNGPQKFSGKCLASARAALTTINRSWDTVGKLDSKKWASFLRWYDQCCNVFVSTFRRSILALLTERLPGQSTSRLSHLLSCCSVTSCVSETRPILSCACARRSRP